MKKVSKDDEIKGAAWQVEVGKKGTPRPNYVIHVRTHVSQTMQVSRNRIGRPCWFFDTLHTTLDKILRFARRNACAQITEGTKTPGFCQHVTLLVSGALAAGPCLPRFRRPSIRDYRWDFGEGVVCVWRCVVGSCHVASCRVRSCRVMSCRIGSGRVVLRRRLMLRRVVLRHCRVIPYRGMLGRVALRRVMSGCVVCGIAWRSRASK